MRMRSKPSPAQVSGDRRGDFRGRAATVADQEGGGMSRRVSGDGGAGDIGADGGDAVGQTLALEELQGAIDGRRLGRLTVLAEAGDQVIGLHRLARSQQ